MAFFCREIHAPEIAIDAFVGAIASLGEEKEGHVIAVISTRSTLGQKNSSAAFRNFCPRKLNTE